MLNASFYTNDTGEEYSCYAQFVHRPIGPYDNEMEFQAGQWLNKVVPPILLILGTLGNIMSFLVLRRPFMLRTWTGFFLRALAVTDTVALWLGLSRHMVKVYASGYDIRNVHDAACKLQRFTLYSFLDLSAWLLVGLTVGRYISTCHIFKSHRFCTIKRAKIVLGVTIGCVVLKNLHVFWTVRLNSNGQDQQLLCNHFCDSDYWYFWKKVLPWVVFCVYAGGPFTCMIILNILIIGALQRSSKFQGMAACRPAIKTPGGCSKSYYFTSASNSRRNSLSPKQTPLLTRACTQSPALERKVGEILCKTLNGSKESNGIKLLKVRGDNSPKNGLSPAHTPTGSRRPSHIIEDIIRKHRESKDTSNHKDFRSKSTTIMLLVVTFSFLLLASPSFINLIIEPYWNANISTPKEQAVQKLVSTIVLLLTYINHSINFLLYCVSGKRFRCELLRMCRCIPEHAPINTSHCHSRESLHRLHLDTELNTGRRSPHLVLKEPIHLEDKISTV